MKPFGLMIGFILLQYVVATLPPWCVMDDEQPFVLWTYTMGWNEAAMIPYYVNHYSRFAKKMIIFDNGSDDHMVALASLCPKVEIRSKTSETGGMYDDGYTSYLANTCWKEAAGKADYVVWSDFDEFINPPANQSWSSFFASNSHATVFKAHAFDMVRMDGEAPLDTSEPLTWQVQIGARTSWSQVYDKTELFSPSAIQETHFIPGIHRGNFVGHVVYGEQVILFHMKYALGVDYARARMAAGHARKSERNLRQGWSLHWAQKDFAKTQVAAILSKAQRVVQFAPLRTPTHCLKIFDFRKIDFPSLSLQSSSNDGFLGPVSHLSDVFQYERFPCKQILLQPSATVVHDRELVLKFSEVMSPVSALSKFSVREDHVVLLLDTESDFSDIEAKMSESDCEKVDFLIIPQSWSNQHEAIGKLTSFGVAVLYF